MSKTPKTDNIYLDLPEGEAVYPWLNEPDTKYDVDGAYKTGLRVPGQAAAKVVQELERIRDDFYAAMNGKDQKTYKTVPVVVVEMDDSGAETGNVIFNAKLKAVGKSQESGETWTQEPRLWDCDGVRIALTDSPIWSKSRLVLRVEVRPYAMASSKTVGVSLRLRDVQVIELVTGGGAASPFASRAGGYRRPASEGDQAGAE